MPTPPHRESVPKLAPGCDVTRLPIGAREGFVLSRVDGASKVSDIANLTGFPLDEVQRIFEKLVELNAAYFGDTPPTQVKPPAPAPAAPAAAPPPSRAAATAPRMRKRPRKWLPKELDEPGDLPVELKTRILDLWHWLDDIDHYELLGVARDVDRKGVKSAYYALASTFHTDRHFGKSLGGFKSKMEQIFSKITSAHDTLANKGKRVEYDAYLEDLDRTRAFERYLSSDEPLEDELASEPPPPPTPEPPRDLAPTAPIDVPPIARMLMPDLPPATPPPTRVHPAEDAARLRREALARRLVGTSSGRFRAAPVAAPPSIPPPVPEVKTVPPVPPTPQQTKDATQALRRRYEEGVDNARRGQALRLTDAAEAALAKGDLVQAANQYRLALRYTDDPELTATYEEVNRRARDLMAETYLKQARYEEQAQKWGAAAISYAKAHEGRPDEPDICERTAHALRMEGRDLHKAARFAELAVQKSPSHPPFRVTLGAVYLDAGLFLRARSELEHAAKLDPNNATIKDLLAKARKMAS